MSVHGIKRYTWLNENWAARLRIFEAGRLWIAKNFSINFAYTYSSFVYHRLGVGWMLREA